MGGKNNVWKFKSTLDITITEMIQNESFHSDTENQK